MAAKTAQFEFWKSVSGLWYWRMRGKNGRIVLQSEGYTTKSNVLKTIETVQNSAHGAIVQQIENE